MNCNNNLIKEGNSMKKLGVIFGGMSTENKVSCVSGASVIKNLNKENMKFIQYLQMKMENGLKFK